MTTTVIDRPTLAPNDPRHGSVAGASAGCNCFRCRVAVNEWKNRRHRQIGYGTWQPWVDAQPVKDHLRKLSEFGIGWEQAALVAGLPLATVSGLLYARGKNREKPATKCRRETAAAILSVEPCIDNVSDRASCDGTGTIRRLRALVALGHTIQSLGQRLPMHPEAAGRAIRNGGRVTGQVARAARDLYAELSTTRPQGWVADRARNMAASRGWAPPLAWDDDTIDDPTAEPNLGEDAPDLIDRIAIDLALAGEQVRLTDAERDEAFRVGFARGLTAYAIGNALHLSSFTYKAIARRITAELAA